MLTTTSETATAETSDVDNPGESIAATGHECHTGCSAAGTIGGLVFVSVVIGVMTS